MNTMWNQDSNNSEGWSNENQGISYRCTNLNYILLLGELLFGELSELYSIPFLDAYKINPHHFANVNYLTGSQINTEMGSSNENYTIQIDTILI